MGICGGKKKQNSKNNQGRQNQDNEKFDQNSNKDQQSQQNIIEKVDDQHKKPSPISEEPFIKPEEKLEIQISKKNYENNDPVRHHLECIRSKIEDGYGKLKINGIVKTENGFKVEIEGSN